MIYSRRRVVGMLAAAPFGVSVVRPSPARARIPGPLPELGADADLPYRRLDVEKSIARRSIVLADGRGLGAFPQGCIVAVPAGVRIPLPWWSWRLRRGGGYADGARLVFRKEGEGKNPLFFAPGKQGVMAVTNNARLQIGLSLEGVDLQAGIGGAALRPVATRHIGLKDMKILGGKNGLEVPSWPCIVEIDNCEIAHCGRGDGYTHNLYVSYVEKFTARRSRFHSAKPEGHAFKCYARFMDIRDCLFANWLEWDDLKDGYYGLLPPLDLGAWGQSLLINNTIYRRDPARNVCIDYRNRQYARGYSKYVPAGWGTTVADYRQVDNRDENNPHLFRHLLYGNRFLNGVLPDNSIDAAIRRDPGYALRNNGSAPWASHGAREDKQARRPDDWQPRNERVVIWAVKNRFEGVPFRRRYLTAPNKNPSDTAPVIESETLPLWARPLIRG